MWLAKQFYLVPKYWMHDNNIKNDIGETLNDIMINHNMPVPHEWHNE